MIYIVIPSLIYYCVAFSVYYVFVTLVQCVYVYSNINGLKLLYLSSILAHILKRRVSLEYGRFTQRAGSTPQGFVSLIVL